MRPVLAVEPELRCLILPGSVEGVMQQRPPGSGLVLDQGAVGGEAGQGGGQGHDVRMIVGGQDDCR